MITAYARPVSAVQLLVMARAPVPGPAKTRLEPLLGPAGCARLQTALIRRASALAGDGGFLAYTLHGSADLFRSLVGPTMMLFPQRGPDLGARMSAAVESAAAMRRGPIAVVGTDCPTLGEGHLDEVAGRLDFGCDVVLGPAHDGGYYLIALAHPDRRVFALPAAAWGGPDVAARTEAAVAGAGLTLGRIGTEHDLDTPDDVPALLGDPRTPAEIRRLFTGDCHR